MERKPKKIVVAGDVTIDWFYWSVKGKDLGTAGGDVPLNWELDTGMRKEVLSGGAMLLARFVKNATGGTIISPQLANLSQIPPEEVLHSTVMLGRFPYSSGRKAEKDMVIAGGKGRWLYGSSHGKIEATQG